MATYKEIRGTQIEAVATDPSNPVEGQVWYNTTSNVLKGQAATSAGSWASGNNMNTARAGLGSAGIQTAALGFGGYSPSIVAITESYNGTNWTEVNDMNTARDKLRGSGVYTAAIAFGGTSTHDPALPGGSVANESYNGTNWTEVNDMNTSRS